MRARKALLGAVVLAAAVMTSLLLAVPALAWTGQRVGAPVHVPKRGAGRGTATNWSGYAVDGTDATSVTGSWTQPTATCTSGENSWSSPWVGIDGDTNSTVEQTGTDSDCVRGQAYYYAWYEMYPKSTVVIRSLTISPGDSITGTVSYGEVLGSWGFTLTLTVTGKGTSNSFSIFQTSRKAERSSVEWIMEGPSNGLLTDFGLVPFTGASGTFGSQAVEPGSPNADPISMVTSGILRAQPSNVNPGATSFGVTWKHS